MKQTHRMLSASLLLMFVLVAFALLFVPTPVAAQTPEQANLRINEFLASNNRGFEDPDEPGNFPDWVELYNLGDTDASLDGLSITDDPANPTKTVFPSGLIVPARGFLVLIADSSPEQGPLHLTFALSASGEHLALYHPASGTLIDEIGFGPQTENVSMGRNVDGAGEWVTFAAPTPGSTNELFAPVISAVKRNPAQPAAEDTVSVTATITDEADIPTATLFYFTAPGMEPIAVPMTADGSQYSGQIPPQPDGTVVSYYIEAADSVNQVSRMPIGGRDAPYRYTVGFQAPPLFLNEIMASNTQTLEDPDQPGVYPDWIELYNAGTEPLSLDGLFLTDDAAEPTKFPIPFGLPSIPAGGYVIFYADGAAVTLGGYHTNFSLSAAGEYVGLYAAGGNALIDEYRFAAIGADVSVGRYPDGSANWQQSGCTTPGAVNTPCEFSDLIYLPLVAAMAEAR